MKLRFEDIADIVPDINKKGLEKLNDKIKMKLVKEGIIKIEECPEHIPKFQKLGTINSPEFEDRMWGFKCTECGVRLHPTEFVKFEVEKHAGLYLNKLTIPKVKTALELSKELLS